MPDDMGLVEYDHLLEKCPLCDSSAFMDGKWFACCNNGDCQCSTGPFDTPEAAIAAWNRRPAIERLLAERDEARAKLFPYADDKQISGMSWNGFYLIGNDKSIKELRRIENGAAQIEVYRAAFDERVAAAEGQRDKLKEALKPFAELAEWIANEHPGWDHDDFVFKALGAEIGLAPFRRARQALKDTPS